ncbi:MAG TPA: hypothetical protein GX512_03800 [Firmicutes bacterium]|nr:hypothetical protein [Candidatus Fermentithermobacillaceae bacterium]
MALTLGSTGDEVLKLQKQLRDAGYDIAADGILGPKTMAAYNDWQRSQPKVEAGNAAYSAALSEAQRQAVGVGVDPSRVDPVYAAMVATGKGDMYTQTAINRGLQQASSLGSTSRTSRSSPGMRSTLTLAEALRQARSALEPTYKQDVENLTRQIGYDLIRRGGYGQPDSPGVVAEGIAPTQASYMARLQSLAQALMEADRQAALQEYAQETARYQLSESSRLAQLEAAQRAAEREAQMQRWLAEHGLERERFDWEKAFRERQLALESQPKPTAPKSAREQFMDAAYTKLMSGQPLTAEEREILGISSDNPIQSAISLAQKDPSWATAISDEEKNAILNYYIRLLTGQQETSPERHIENLWREQGLVK